MSAHWRKHHNERSCKVIWKEGLLSKDRSIKRNERLAWREGVYKVMLALSELIVLFEINLKLVSLTFAFRDRARVVIIALFLHGNFLPARLYLILAIYM